MPYITLGAEAAVTVNLSRCGAAVAIPDDATVRGQFYAPDGATTCSPELIALATDEFAAWHLGTVAFHLTAADTAALAHPTALLYVTANMGGTVEEWWVRFTVISPADTAGSALFPDRAQAIEGLRQILRASEGLPASLVGMASEYLWGKLQAAEASAERALRVYLGPVEVLPEVATQAEKDALTAAGTRWVEEPGYDLEPGFFSGDRWGLLTTRHAPLLAVHGMEFVYPLPASPVFRVPDSWIRVDKKYGQIRLVPGAQAFAAPMAAWTMQVLGGGRTVPHMIQLRYRAGLEDPARQYPDLVNLVRRMAVMEILLDPLLPASQSISADGLSESKSIDLSKYQDTLNAALERLRQAIHGVDCLVF